MRLAVVGHVEWIEFLAVERVPAAGEIAEVAESWAEPAGGGAVAVAQLARLAGEATLFTALGHDEPGRRCEQELRARGVRVNAVYRDAPQRRGFTYLDADGERTITVIGERLDPRGDDALPWDDLAEFDGVYLTAGDVGAVRHARSARILVATARILSTLRAAGVELDALVRSHRDPREQYEGGDLDSSPRLVATTEGAAGGRYDGREEGRWTAAPLPGPHRDSYGAGDSFAAGLTYALARGDLAPAATTFAASCAAEALARRGAHG
jgi:ribokinase